MQKSIAQRSYRKKDQDQKKLSEAKIKEPFGEIRSRSQLIAYDADGNPLLPNIGRPKLLTGHLLNS